MKPTAPLISTKFAPPRIGGHAVLREQLLARLQQGRQSRLLLVTGAAGFGKSTLLAQWRQSLVRDGASVAWLSLSTDDGAPDSFCASLIGALQQAEVPLEDELPWLGMSEATEHLQAIASVLINAIARVNAELYLMLDDFHHAADPAIARLMQALVDGAPHNLHIVIASRTAPGLLLGRLRAMGELCEVDCAELSFDFRESLAFLKAHLDGGIDADTAHSIHELTQGWPIGVQLVSIALKSNPGRRPSIGALLPNSVGLASYLAEDVMAGLPAELIDFLQKISILRRFNEPLAAWVSEAPEASRLIGVIEARNLFLLPVDAGEEHHWFRLHPMFVEFLAQRLQAGDIDVPRLQRRAAEWFEQAGMVEDALHHALLSEDFELVGQLLERLQPTDYSVSHLIRFMRWVERVPRPLLAGHPSLVALCAWGCVVAALPDQAEGWVAVLEAATDPSPWRVQIALMRAVIASQREELPASLELLPPADSLPPERPLLAQVHACVAINCLARLGQYAEARSLLHAPAARALHSSSSEMAFIARFAVANAALLEGNVLEAERIGAPILAQAEALHGRRSTSACLVAATMSEVFYELDRLDEAREALANRLDVLDFAVQGYTICAALCHAQMLLLQVSVREALGHLEKMEVHFRSRGFPRGVVHMLAGQLRMALHCGDWRHAGNLQATLEELAANFRTDNPVDREIVALVALSRARLALFMQDPETSLRALEEVGPFVERYGRGIWRVRRDILQALALDALGEEAQALRCLHAALASGYRFGLRRTFLDEGEALQALLARLELPEDAVLEAYRQSLLPQAPVESPARARRALVDAAASLTPREQDILALLEQPISNKRIALALNLSLDTVKWNLKNIYAKLGVTSRYEAVVAARRRSEG
ncbi:LuxR C-terminal-related transcriptional regulator [Pseudomonas schmalbachii]|uniref:AAA family ATPase n=1 Tax=Pseudomonas schmalbachii TaxID=2816993 RepID=A0ABS3TUP2_9PSED|nr:LuxR C-terminal-related transcriptional regulator [Pseudomonas schmalbachii]MBO3277382.1 AAA family ATPase [Pseudomonas schmalbachii]